MTNSANLPAPYAGVDDKTPTAALQNPFCENLLNFNVTQAGISLRHGDSKYAVTTFAANTKSPKALGVLGGEIFAAIYNSTISKMQIYDATDLSTVAFTSAASLGDANMFPFVFNQHLYFFTELNYAPGFVYDGATWSLAGFTGFPGTAGIRGAGSFNHRIYLIQFGLASTDGAVYHYGGIDAISGAVTTVDLSSIVEEKTQIYIISPITVSNNAENRSYLAFVCASGEVLFYSGSYPDSASWALAGQAKIGRPLGPSAYIKYQGDTLILCDSGVVSLRDLFLDGSEQAIDLSVNANIQRRWIYMVENRPPILAGTDLALISGVWDNKNHRIIIPFPAYLDSEGAVQTGASYFVFDTLLKSWSVHRSHGVDALNHILAQAVIFNRKVLLISRDVTANSRSIMIYKKEGSTGFMDRNVDDTADVGYDYEMLSAPIPFPKTAVYETTQIEPILESDLYAQTSYNFVADFGRQTSADQKTDAATTSVAKPAANVGMQNITFVQVKMSGTTVAAKTVGLDLYSYNVWYNSGETGSR